MCDGCCRTARIGNSNMRVDRTSKRSVIAGIELRRPHILELNRSRRPGTIAIVRCQSTAHLSVAFSNRIRSAIQLPRFNPHSNGPTAVQFNGVVGIMPTVRVGGVVPLITSGLLSLTLCRTSRIGLASKALRPPAERMCD